MNAVAAVTRRSGANPPLVHPGKAMHERLSSARTATVPFEIDLRTGDVVEVAILDAFDRAGFASGWVQMDGLRCDPLRYVIPAQPDTTERLAWYSETRDSRSISELVHGFMSVGRNGHSGSTHCHGVWRLADGTDAMGHLLADESRMAKPATLQAMGFTDAVFDRRPDPETRFDLFAAIQVGVPPTTPGAIAVTLRPNEGLSAACRSVCARYGIDRADVVGLGSLNGAAFQDGGRMNASISEFVIRHGRIDLEGTDAFDLAVVDLHGNQFAGEVWLDQASVSITAEVVILPVPIEEGTFHV